MGETSSAQREFELALVRRIIRICQDRDIDVIFPSYDVDMLLITKYADLFSDLNIEVIAPAFNSIAACSEKYRSMQKSQEFGIPCPATELCGSIEQMTAFFDKCGGPVIVKRRFHGGAKQVFICNSSEDLKRLDASHDFAQQHFIIQEYIPGGVERSLNVLIDRDGLVKTAFLLRKAHHCRASVSTSVEIMKPPEDLVRKVASLFSAIGFLGLQHCSSNWIPGMDSTNSLKSIRGLGLMHAYFSGWASIFLSNAWILPGARKHRKLSFPKARLVFLRLRIYLPYGSS